MVHHLFKEKKDPIPVLYSIGILINEIEHCEKSCHVMLACKHNQQCQIRSKMESILSKPHNILCSFNADMFIHVHRGLLINLSSFPFKLPVQASRSGVSVARPLPLCLLESLPLALSLYFALSLSFYSLSLHSYSSLDHALCLAYTTVVLLPCLLLPHIKQTTRERTKKSRRRNGHWGSTKYSTSSLLGLTKPLSNIVRDIFCTGSALFSFIYFN